MQTNQTVATTMFLALFVVACGSSNSADPAEVSTTEPTAIEPSPTSTTSSPPSSVATTIGIDGVLDTLPVPSPDPDRVAWARKLVEVINTLQAERAVANEQFTRMWRPNEFGYETQRALYESDVNGLQAALATLPPLFDPPEQVDAALATYVDATRLVADDARRILESLIEREDELRSSLRDDRGRSPAIDAILDGHPDLVERWQNACFDLQLSIAELDVDLIDCIGTGIVDAEPLPDGINPSDVTVTAACIRGDSFDELPFDHTSYGFLAARPSDTNWIRTVVTITNTTAARIQVDPNFLVRWFDADDETIVTTEWLEAWAPSLSAHPGQTAIRTGYSFEGSQIIAARDDLPVELFEQVFNTAAGCELVGTPAFSVIGDDEFVDPNSGLLVEQTECRRDDPAGLWRVSYRVTNEGDVPVRVNIGAELLDKNGDRQGSGGGGENVVVAAGETVESAGWSVYYTIADVDAVVECRLLEVALM